MADPPPPFPGKTQEPVLSSPYPPPRMHPRAAPPSHVRHPPTVSPLPSSPPLLVLPILPCSPASIFLTKTPHARTRVSPLSLISPSLFSLLCIPSFFAFVSPDPVHSFSTWNSTVFLHVRSSPPFPLAPPPGCLGSSQGEISISFEFQVSLKTLNSILMFL